jgi:glycosyltransferase involved in cell wall biosynthesis
MKILFVAPSAYILGGVQDWLYSLTLGLRRRGYDICVAIPNNNFHNGIKYNNYYDQINAIFFTNKTGTAQGRIDALSELIIKNKADLIVGVNIGDLYKAYALSYSHILDSRIAMTLHAIEGDYLGDIGRYSPILDGVITTNRLTQDIVRDLHLIDEDRVLYAPYGVKPNNRSASAIDTNSLRIAWVGRFDYQQKRVHDLYHILQSLDSYGVNYTLSIAGDGPLKDKLRNDFDKWIQDGKVNMVGFLNKSQLESFYNSHNILLITSEWETGPIVAWEAMLAGLVVVSSEYIGISQEKALINEQTALLFPVGSHELAAKQICRLVEDQLFQRLAIAGQSMAMRRYSLDSSLASWETAFLSVMHSPTKSKKLQQYPMLETTGMFENVFGTKVSEILRRYLGRKGYCRDPGSEWPHSTYGHTNLEPLFKYAKLLEQNP